MRTIKQVTAMDNYFLECIFEDGSKKMVNLRPLLNTEVFKPLADQKSFSEVHNCGYFIEWKKFEVDLSADTLWHMAAADRVK